jgi:hypothetical protein
MKWRWKNYNPGFQDGEKDLLRDTRELLLVIATAVTGEPGTAGRHLTEYLSRRREGVEDNADH